MCIWDSKKKQYKTECEDPFKSLKKQKKGRVFVGCGCCANSNEPNPPQYCTTITSPSTSPTSPGTILSSKPTQLITKKSGKKKSQVEINVI
jgi:hypothetical protein